MDEDCTIYQTMDFVGKRWTLLILLELYKCGNKKRYSVLKKSLLDISPKILSSRLKELEEYKLIRKEMDASSVPIKCYYSLTKEGDDFIAIIKRIKKWAIKWKHSNKVCKATNCQNCTL